MIRYGRGWPRPPRAVHVLLRRRDGERQGIPEPSVVDATLRRRRDHGLVSPLEARAPPTLFSAASKGYDDARGVS
jgi:hypothetical protein